MLVRVLLLVPVLLLMLLLPVPLLMLLLLLPLHTHAHTHTHTHTHTLQDLLQCARGAARGVHVVCNGFSTPCSEPAASLQRGADTGFEDMASIGGIMKVSGAIGSTEHLA